MEKRMIVAMVLSVLVILGFQVLKPKQPAEFQTMKAETAATVQDKETAAPTGMTAMAESTEEYGPVKEELTVVRTEPYTLIFSNAGGSLKAIALNKYQQDGQPELLYREDNPARYMFAIKSDLTPGISRKAFTLEKRGNTLEYSYVAPGELEIIKKYNLHDGLEYMEAEVIVRNLTKREIGFSYEMVGPTGLDNPRTQLSAEDSKASGVDKRFLEADTKIGETVWKTKVAKGVQERSGEILWTGLKSRHFAVVLDPLGEAKAVRVTPIDGKSMEVSVKSPSLRILPGKEAKEGYRLYVGPIDAAKLASVGEGLDEIVDNGFFGPISKVLLSVLRFFHKVTHSWGLSIILMTLLVNILLFPLTLKSFSSMHQMKKVQPHVQKLKEMHKDNPQKMNKEMMELYKKYNVNPLGGCLPMLLQMPIFIALYQGLMRSIELKGTSFLWIKDLSRPDAVHIPVTLPFVGDSINILPLLMVGMMAVQQKISQGMTPATGDQASQQKMMMLMMPLLFGFIFYNMPAGLVLYWLTNTILMTSEQALISKKMS